LRDELIRVRVTKRERERADAVAEKLGTSVSAAYRQAMNRLYDQIFKRSPNLPK
jgi:antitoxin component of RelBE/YafQ-DinJ toxin-antitoxin module